MSLRVRSGRNSGSFSRCPAIGLDRGAAPWVHGLYSGSCPALSYVVPAWPTKADPQALGRIQARASFLLETLGNLPSSLKCF